METIIAFLGAHWIWFLIIAILLVFALIGYFVDSNSIEEDKGEIMRVGDTTKVDEVESLPNINGTLNDTINNNNEILEPAPAENTETLDTTPTEEQNTTTETLIEEQNNDVSTFQG